MDKQASAHSPLHTQSTVQHVRWNAIWNKSPLIISNAHEICRAATISCIQHGLFSCNAICFASLPRSSVFFSGIYVVFSIFTFALTGRIWLVILCDIDWSPQAALACRHGKRCQNIISSYSTDEVTPIFLDITNLLVIRRQFIIHTYMRICGMERFR